MEGTAKAVAKDDQRYEDLLDALRGKNPLAARFTAEGILFRVEPRRLMMRKGVHTERQVLEFPTED